MRVGEHVLAEIERSPRGPKIGAFFDFDGTLIAGYSATAFYRERLRRGQVPLGEMLRSFMAGLDMGLRGADVSGLMKIAVRSWEGRSVDEIEELSERLFVQSIAGSVFPEARQVIEAHRRRGHTVAMASSATRYQLGPLARDLEIENVLCTEVGVQDGLFTGDVAGPILWGPAKAAAVQAFSAERGVDLRRSFGYANGDEDVPFLESVANPRPINPGSHLAEVAAERGWPVLRFRSRGLPGPLVLARTAAAYVGMSAAMWASLGVGLVNRRRRDAVDLTMSIGSDLALALAGIRLDVKGTEHLWSDRPAIFIFNHQSGLDVPIIASLIRRDLTGVAKKELARSPLFGPIARLADVAFVERGNVAQARAALEPALQRLAQGISIAIAPEGTRSPSPKLGPFKKGAFHLAMQAGVPIVPIVIRNAGDVMWRSSLVMRPGTVEIVVHRAIPTAGWTPEQLNERVQEVRQLYVDTLADWPGKDAGRRTRRAPRAAGSRARAPAG